MLIDPARNQFIQRPMQFLVALLEINRLLLHNGRSHLCTLAFPEREEPFLEFRVLRGRGGIVLFGR